MAEVVKSETGRRIVVAVVESKESTHALQWLLRNLLRAVPAGSRRHAHTGVCSAFAAGVPRDGRSEKSHIKEVADSVMEKAQSICEGHGNVKVDSTVCIEDPRVIICQVVEKLGTNLLVIDNHSYGFIKRSFLGSVSDHCARNVKCPILIMKRQAK